MATHLEENLQRDIDRIRSKVTSMGELAERALKDCVTALRERNRQLAYAVILRDRHIDELESAAGIGLAHLCVPGDDVSQTNGDALNARAILV